MKRKTYTKGKRIDICDEVRKVMKRDSVRQCDLSIETGLPWLCVHRVSSGKVIPSSGTAMILEDWLNRRNGGK